jgi:hypothetical protein
MKILIEVLKEVRNFLIEVDSDKLFLICLTSLGAILLLIAPGCIDRLVAGQIDLEAQKKVYECRKLAISQGYTLQLDQRCGTLPQAVRPAPKK